MSAVVGTIVGLNVRGTIVSSGAYNWDYYWLSRFVSDLALSQTDDDVTLTWVNNGTVDWDYILIERKLSGGDYAQIAQITKTLETYTDEDFTVEGTYYYRIRLIKGTHYSSYCTAVSIAVSLAPDGSPSALIVTGITDTTQTFSYTIGSTNHDGHRLYMSTDGGVNYSLKASVLGATSIIQATGLTAGALYYFYVVAYKGTTESTATNIYDTYFKITVDTTKAGSANDTFILPLPSAGTYDYYIDWGDGAGEQHITANTSQTKDYGTSGIRQIKIRGTFPRIYFNNAGDKLKLTTIDNWGNIKWSSMQNAFYGCSNMDSNYNDAPNTSAVTTTVYMFNGCSKFNGKVNFDVSQVVSFSSMFLDCTLFNQPLTNWNTSSALDMSQLFRNCQKFNQSVSHLDLSDVIICPAMFYGCAEFNQPVPFDTSSCEDMHAMFRYCTVFNQSVATFDTSLNTDFNQFFGDCKAFNQSVANFNTSNGLDFSTMFLNCWVFDQDVSGFDTSLNVEFNDMFNGAKVFNHAVPFDTSSCAGASGSMANMFNECKLFNQSVATFDTSGVVSMQSMFQGCSVFNQSVNFDCSACTNIGQMFQGCAVLNSNITLSNFTGTTANALFSGCKALNSTISVDLSHAISLSSLFSDCKVYNQSIAWLTTTACTNMQSMFAYCTAFNQSVAGLNTSNVLTINDMFDSCSNFNQDVSSFNTAKVTNMASVFLAATVFNQSLASWDISSVTTMANMFAFSNNLSTANYDATLIAWSALTVKASVPFHAGDAKYSVGAATTARGVLTDAPNNWVITDGGQV